MGFPPLERVLEFQKLLLEFRAISRIVYIPHKDQSENDVEHSYFLAMMAWYIASAHPESGLSTDKILRYALVHDLVEIHAGDTFAFASKDEREQKKVREAAALEKLAQDHQDFPDMIEYIHAYESKSDKESQFVSALDKILPIILNYFDGGRIWKEYMLTLEHILENKRATTKHSPVVSQYLEELADLLSGHPGHFHDPEAVPAETAAEPDLA